ncbi:PEP-CTERM sorting domain-containing protein [Sphingomonas sp. SFZ2018-12]|uniref:PEP-CTERM sorting domain-containing protein n=1 Tax=Sphingomonas sp. SFZ2018-12 TaxID=2683197 RepID=UPI001F0FDECC|nr:PEP-CTERM sorting domain-containing protein [Sphingomonas sp. SFZ2018-12]
MKPLVQTAIIVAALALPAGLASAYDKPPSHPPRTGSSGGSTGGSSGGKPAAVPEPAEMALFGMGIAGLVAGRWIGRRRKAQG